MSVSSNRSAPGAALDAQLQLLTVATQIQIGVAPGVQFRGAAQRLAATLMGGALASMMHERDGGMVIALQAAQIGKQGGDFRGDVLIDAMQAHHRVKQGKERPEKSHGRLQGLLVLLAIEPQRGHGDNMDIEALELDACGMGDAFQTPSHVLRGVLGSKQQDASGARGSEMAQTRGAGGDGDGEIKRQKMFSRLWVHRRRFRSRQRSTGPRSARAVGPGQGARVARRVWSAASRACSGAPGRLAGVGGKDLEIELLVELGELAFGGDH